MRVFCRDILQSSYEVTHSFIGSASWEEARWYQNPSKWCLTDLVSRQEKAAAQSIKTTKGGALESWQLLWSQCLALGLVPWRPSLRVCRKNLLSPLCLTFWWFLYTHDLIPAPLGLKSSDSHPHFTGERTKLLGVKEQSRITQPGRRGTGPKWCQSQSLSREWSGTQRPIREPLKRECTSFAGEAITRVATSQNSPSADGIWAVAKVTMASDCRRTFRGRK